MNDPIKIIHKYKNNQKRVQYNVNIYIGPVEQNIMTILNTIKDMSMQDTLINIDINDINLLTNKYGEYWYVYFFILPHIKHTLKIINKNIIVNKFGEKWYEKHISDNNIVQKETLYNFSNVFRPIKIDKRIYTDDVDFKNYYYTYGQHGGTDVTTDDDIEKIYEETSASETSALIIDVFEDKNIINKNIANITSFDSSYDNDIQDVLLKNIFKKTYVTTQYILKDDNIKTIKNKIFCGQLNHTKFGDKLYILPSRQYLWSEYYYNNNKEQIPIGHKWLKRNEILQIDVEPNANISIYEDLHGNLVTLRDNFKKYGSKIRLENNDSTILNDYDGYYSNNEIYMIDIYNELGKNYKPEHDILKNIFDVYIRLYFPKIKYDEFKNIINLLNSTDNNTFEHNYIIDTFNLTNNDLILENEITFLVENTKNNYIKHITDSYITHSFIYIKLNKTFNLYNIFNDFETDENIPFIQYNDIFKYNENIIENSSLINHDILSKWFNTVVHGISFKFKIADSNKYMIIHLNENGRLDYKTQWKETDSASIENITKTYNYIRMLIKRIDNTCELPKDSDFKFAFMNTIQKFNFGNNNINHNELSEFARFFYPYISLVIDPRKRKSKSKINENKSKYGTYLRFKRESGYENQTKIEQRILYFMRNYEMNEKKMANELSKQFNITEDKAMDHINKMTEKYSSVRKSRKILKIFDQASHIKPPGVNIDIQGKMIDRYKIRISGTKNKNQLLRIIDFLNVFLFLYNKVYLDKDTEFQYLLNKLKKLTNIAKRRNKVNDIYEIKEEKNIKKITKKDKNRLGFRPEKGQNHWTRSCQNSGPNKKRQPIQYSVTELLENGYDYNDDTKLYEKKLKNGEIIRAVKLPELDETGFPTGNEFYYACDPNNNNTHIHIDFLSKSNNPNNLCMPCCFIKDPYISNNFQKKKHFINCINEEYYHNEDKKGDISYILQDTNKIKNGRIGFLPQLLDKYFNEQNGLKIKISQHLLIQTLPHYYFKLGNNDFTFIHAISIIFDFDMSTIRKLMISSMEKDVDDILFTTLNEGNIRQIFQEKNKYIDYLKYNIFYNHHNIVHLISLPNVLSTDGFNIIIFNKYNDSHDFNLIHQSYNDNDLTNTNRNTIIILKDNKYYFPIVRITKIDKDLKIDKIFKNSDNIIHHINEYYKTSNNYEKIPLLENNQLSAKDTIKLLEKNFNMDNIQQIIDSYYKCIYLVIDNNIIPVKPSGTLLIPIITDYEKYIQNFDNTIKYLNKFNEFKLLTKPIGIYINNNKIVGIMTEMKQFVPIIHIEYNKDKYNHYIIENKPLHNIIDDKINEKAKGKLTKNQDKRITEIIKYNYIKEGYELFRLEFSNYINNNIEQKEKLNQILKNKKKNIIKEFINEFVNNNVHIGDFPDLENYKINNFRKICNEINNCLDNKHCLQINNKCMFTITKNTLIQYINKLITELMYSDYKTKELLKIDDYYVSTIINKNHFKIIQGQKIIKSTSNFSKIIDKIIKKDNKIICINEFPLVKIKNIYIQKIINDNLSLFRAISNCIYWNTHQYFDAEIRNLGYYSELQTVMANYLKSIIIEWLLNKNNNKEIIYEFIKNMPYYNKINIEDFAIQLSSISNIKTNCLIELALVNLIFKFNILVYSNNNDHLYIFDKSGIIYNKFDNKINKKLEIDILDDYLLLKFNFNQNQYIPLNIDSIYI